jgi:AraC-like DNA-binding protein
MSSKFNILSIQENFSQEISLGKEDKFYSVFFLKSSSNIEITSGFVSSKAGSFLVRAPGSSLVIAPSEGSPLSVSVISFTGSDASKLIRISDIQTEIVYSPMHCHFSDSIFGKIISEDKSRNPEWQTLIVAYLIELFSKILRLSNHDLLEQLPDHAQRLRDLRSEIHENYSKPWKIGDMAKIMGLSPSRFASLYKNEFKISPTEDLIQTRIDQAKKMLSGSKVSIKKVSAACGFESVHYFHRAFKKRSSITPKHFQNKQFANSGSVYTAERHFSLDRLTQQAEFSGIIDFIDGEIRFHGNTDHLSTLLGYPAQQLRDEPFINFVSPKDLQKAADGVKLILSNKNILDLSINLIHQNGFDIPVEFSALLKGKNWFWFIKQSSLQTI